MTGKLDPKIAKARKIAAAYQQQLRKSRDAKKQCRICGKPAAVSKKTGKIAKLCKRHLAVDAHRKVIRALHWLGDDPIVVGGKLRYALSWA